MSTDSLQAHDGRLQTSKLGDHVVDVALGRAVDDFATRRWRGRRRVLKCGNWGVWRLARKT
eukprot:1067658-Prymnesium_polylepis.1